MKTARHVLITGRVQGVGFRAFVEDQAVLLGLQGWVRNRREGAVEALFFGEPDAVERIVGLCRTGPRGARVDDIECRDEAAAEAHPGFVVLPTA